MYASIQSSFFASSHRPLSWPSPLHHQICPIFSGKEKNSKKNHAFFLRNKIPLRAYSLAMGLTKKTAHTMSVQAALRPSMNCQTQNAPRMKHKCPTKSKPSGRYAPNFFWNSSAISSMLSYKSSLSLVMAPIFFA